MHAATILVNIGGYSAEDNNRFYSGILAFHFITGGAAYISYFGIISKYN
jgi:hypothetical protein